MENNLLLTFVIYYSLFKKKLLEDNEIIHKLDIPKNSFGVFTTVRRIKKNNNNDVHGCIGYWSHDYKIIGKDELYNNLLRVSYDAMVNDNRRHQFSPIEKEPNSYLEIDFMMKPIYTINKNNGIINELNKKFDNNEFGIIIQNNGNKATYLPHVFPNISWENLLQSIKEKANIFDENYKLYAYKIIQFKGNISLLLLGNVFSYLQIFEYTHFLTSNIKKDTKYPFIYEIKNGNVIWNEHDEVRNIATIGSILKYSNTYKDLISRKELEYTKEKALEIINSLDKFSSQALSFLGFLYEIVKINNKEKYCKKLTESLINADEEFEKPELIIGLLKAGCNVKKVDLSFTKEDSIFKMNWVTQALLENGKIPSIREQRFLEEKIREIIENKEKMETNYLAVSFEALCYLFKRNENNNLLIELFELYVELEKRKLCKNIFYGFLHGECRVDITEHVINGLYELSMDN